MPLGDGRKKTGQVVSRFRRCQRTTLRELSAFGRFRPPTPQPRPPTAAAIQGEQAMFGVKKILIGSAAAAGVGAFVFGRDMSSYVRTGAHAVRESIKREVPVEFEIERAKEMVKQT